MTDIIDNCAFGIEMNALPNEESEFRRIGKNVFHLPWTDFLRFKIKVFLPWLYDMLDYIFYCIWRLSTFSCILSWIICIEAYREKNNIVRYVFIDVLRELKKHLDKMGNIGKYCLRFLIFCTLLHENFLDRKLYKFIHPKYDYNHSKTKC